MPYRKNYNLAFQALQYDPRYQAIRQRQIALSQEQARLHAALNSYDVAGMPRDPKVSAHMSHVKDGVKAAEQQNIGYVSKATGIPYAVVETAFGPTGMSFEQAAARLNWYYTSGNNPGGLRNTGPYRIDSLGIWKTGSPEDIAAHKHGGVLSGLDLNGSGHISPAQAEVAKHQAQASVRTPFQVATSGYDLDTDEQSDAEKWTGNNSRHHPSLLADSATRKAQIIHDLPGNIWKAGQVAGDTLDLVGSKVIPGVYAYQGWQADEANREYAQAFAIAKSAPKGSPDYNLAIQHMTELGALINRLNKKYSLATQAQNDQGQTIMSATAPYVIAPSTNTDIAPEGPVAYYRKHGMDALEGDAPFILPGALHVLGGAARLGARMAEGAGNTIKAMRSTATLAPEVQRAIITPDIFDPNQYHIAPPDTVPYLQRTPVKVTPPSFDTAPRPVGPLPITPRAPTPVIANIFTELVPGKKGSLPQHDYTLNAFKPALANLVKQGYPPDEALEIMNRSVGAPKLAQSLNDIAKDAGSDLRVNNVMPIYGAYEAEANPNLVFRVQGPPNDIDAFQRAMTHAAAQESTLRLGELTPDEMARGDAAHPEFHLEFGRPLTRQEHADIVNSLASIPELQSDNGPLLAAHSGIYKNDGAYSLVHSGFFADSPDEWVDALVQNRGKIDQALNDIGLSAKQTFAKGKAVYYVNPEARDAMPGTTVGDRPGERTTPSGRLIARGTDDLASRFETGYRKFIDSTYALFGDDGNSSGEGGGLIPPPPDPPTAPTQAPSQQAGAIFSPGGTPAASPPTSAAGALTPKRLGTLTPDELDDEKFKAQSLHRQLRDHATQHGGVADDHPARVITAIEQEYRDRDAMAEYHQPHVEPGDTLVTQDGRASAVTGRTPGGGFVMRDGRVVTWGDIHHVTKGA